MTPFLIVFIDSFPFYYLERTSFLSSLPKACRIIPGIGYSSTCQVELLSGLTQDEIGYFGEWIYDPGNSPFRKWNWLLRTMSFVKHIYYMDRVAHRILKKISGFDIKNIPLSYLHYFNSPYLSVFDKQFPHDSILNLPNVEGVFSYDYGGLPLDKIDYAVYRRAKQLISVIPESNHLFVSMTKLDHVGHFFGVDSPRYREKVEELDKWVEDLYERWVKRFPSGQLIILSDHGMVNVKRKIYLNLEHIFGKPTPSSYTYFLDGTLLRIWSDNGSLIYEIYDYLNSLNIGSILSSEERDKFGIRSPKFGNIIFVLSKSSMFVPSFWGRGASKGMHGYHPKNMSQYGIFLMSDCNNKIAIKNKLRTTDIYSIIRKILSS